MKLSRIAEILKCELKGDGDTEITGVAGIDEAEANQLTFVANPKYIPKIKVTRAGAIILGADAPAATIPTLVAPDPYVTFAKAIEIFYQPPKPLPGIHPTATVSPGVALGDNASIGANVVIGEGSRLGKNCVLYPNVTLYPFVEIGDDFVAHSNSVVREHSKIGHRVILQNGAVIGADGFGFAPQPNGPYYKIIQSGVVVLEDDVEIGANTCVDRATVGETRIGRGTKLDNLVQIGHGSRLGEDTAMAAQAGVAGSTRVGNRVFLAGQVGAAGHLTIGDGVVAIAQTGIARSVEPGKIISGSPEMDFNLWKKNYLLMLNFPDLVQTVKHLKKEVEELKKKLAERE
ncbi:MAG: UDP-3-O-(3-hydroxymyristoyl)glucosamine N-acyltransferase [Acidobacteria bacterium]|nr:MAG: UDP-3-O-(3-hydroxymyristoyl)glucosamine N-acyltransferase [Acidobacteriota bacterium]